MAIVFEEIEILSLRLELPYLFGEILNFLLDDVVLLRMVVRLLGLGSVDSPRLSLLLAGLIIILEDYDI